MIFKHSTSFSVAFLATATLLLSSNVSAHGNICSKTDFPALCEPFVKANSDAVSATASAINALILKTTHAKLESIKLRKTLSSQKANLDTCTEVYDDAISNLFTSLSNLKSRDKASLNINLSAALTDYVTCQDSFLETRGGSCPLGKTNEHLRKMASNALALSCEIH